MTSYHHRPPHTGRLLGLSFLCAVFTFFLFLLVPVLQRLSEGIATNVHLDNDEVLSVLKDWSSCLRTNMTENNEWMKCI